MSCVLDCSLALAWALPDETSERADRCLVPVSPKDVFWVRPCGGKAPWRKQILLRDYVGKVYLTVVPSLFLTNWRLRMSEFM